MSKKNKEQEKLLFVIDMDDTLLTDEKIIPDSTIEYLKNVQQMGHMVMLASGRPVRALKYFYDKLGLHSPMICYNGAYLYHPYDDKFPSFHFTFSQEIIKEIYNDCKEYITNVMCETDSTIWQEERDDELSKFFWHDGMDITYGDIRETLDSDPWTMIMCDKSEDDNDKIVAATKKHKGYKVRFWYNCAYSEIYHKNTSKLNCLKTVAKYYKIKRKNIVCIGDAENDVGMISWAGVGVAMINGCENARRNANIITKKDNNHEGVKDVIQYVLDNFDKIHD